MGSKDGREKDFYAVLGVPKSASADEIKRSYRKLARELHPDHNPGNAEAEDRFKAVSEAYDVLSDAGRRKEYDEMRSLFGAGAFRRGARTGGGPGPGGFDPSDLSDLFGGFGGGGAPRPARARAPVLLSACCWSGGGGGGGPPPRRAPAPRGARKVEAEVTL